MEIFFVVLLVFSIIAAGVVSIRFAIRRAHNWQPSPWEFLTLIRWIAVIILIFFVMAFSFSEDTFDLKGLYAGLFFVSIIGALFTTVDYFVSRLLLGHYRTNSYKILFALLALIFAISMGSPGIRH